MEIGVGYFGDIDLSKGLTNAIASREIIQSLIDQAILADQVGLDVFAVGEHHRADYAVSSPHTLLAGIATITKNIKLMSAVNVLSSSDPIALYQSYATIAAMSKGRAEMGIGRGSFIESFPVFGYDLSDYEILFEEKFDLLLQAIHHEKVTWSGKTRSPLHQIGIYPRTEQALPVWIAVGGTPSSVLRAAKAGLPLILAIIGGNISAFLPLVQYYKDQYIKHGHDPLNMQIGVHAHTLILPDSASREEYFLQYAAQMDRIGQDRGWSPYAMHQFLAGMQEDGALFMGTEEQVHQKINYIKDLFGLTRFIAHMDVGAPKNEWLIQTIESLGNYKKNL